MYRKRMYVEFQGLDLWLTKPFSHRGPKINPSVVVISYCGGGSSRHDVTDIEPVFLCQLFTDSVLKLGRRREFFSLLNLYQDSSYGTISTRSRTPGWGSDFKFSVVVTGPRPWRTEIPRRWRPDCRSGRITYWDLVIQLSTFIFTRREVEKDDFGKTNVWNFQFGQSLPDWAKKW